jgi:phospholipid-transporting ATPase
MEFKYCVIGDVCYQYMRGNLEENSEKEENFRIEENITPFKKYQMYRSIHDEGDDNDNDKNVKSNFLSKKKTIRLPKKTYPNYIIKSEDNSVSLSLEKTDSIQEHFWYALSLCHTCTVELNDKGLEEYICVSPDSIELVKAAKAQGWSYEESGNPNIKRVKVGDFGAENINFEKLQIIEFSSDRKRETIIIKNPEGKIILYCKGADSIIEKRLSKNSNSQILAQSKYYVDKFSAQGLRTLFVAMKIISNKEYNTFAKELNEAMISLENKDQKIGEIYDKMEKNLYLIGTTIVEDKLQSKVPETIRDLRLAKIKIWMLTGDKMNTAYNIGLSCNLISKNMKTFSVCGIEPKVDSLSLEIINKEERDQIIINFAKEFSKFKGECDSMQTPPQFGILVDEKALITINEDSEIQKIFLDIAKDAVAVICCRVSPLQKSQVVKMMKNYYPNSRTLAIGDGGNDVSMIMEAHIGVGIYGEEGMRAVQSSDYAIGEFRFLHSLLFFHGRTNYLRNAECILYFFYKNFVFTILQFFFGFYCNFTGQTIIDDWYITLFNLLFTSLPLGARALLDQDVKPDDNEVVYLMLPFLYLENRENQIFTIKNFFIYLMKGTVHSFINFFWVINYLDESINQKGNIGGLWVCSVNLFTNILLIVSIDLLIYTKYHTWINVVILISVTFISYIIFLSLVHNMTMFNSVGAIYYAFISGRFWMNMIFVGGTCALIDFFILGFKHIFQPSLANILQMLLNQNVVMDKNYINDLPKPIREKMEIYNEFTIDDNEDKLKKEITQKTMIKNNNNELKLKPKNKGGNQNNYYNFNNENGGIIKDKNSAINELDDSRKNTTIQKDNRYLENRLVKNRNNIQESNHTPSLENSNHNFGSKRKSDNKNISSDLKNSLNNDNKTKDFLINEVIYYNNHDFLNSAKKLEDDAHSQNALIHKKKVSINGVNGSINKNNNKNIYY